MNLVDSAELTIRCEYDEPVMVGTTLTWDDLVLPDATIRQLRELERWLLGADQLPDRWGLGQGRRAGLTALFCGPPGSGKTLAASLLGAACGCDVYRVDLASLASKWIGETEENLARVLDQADRTRCVLFFDEADALFGERAPVSDAHDRFANLEVGHLLQRIEAFDGVVIVATNRRASVDEAFARRFRWIVEFPVPRAQERVRLWMAALPEHVAVREKDHVRRLAERYAVTGGTIRDVVRDATLRAVLRGDGIIRLEDLEQGLRRDGLGEEDRG